MSAVIGSITLPLAAGSPNTALEDPLLMGLLDYVAFCLNRDLSAKLAMMGGQPNEAVPTGKRYPYNPQRALARNGFPALYLWRHEAAPRVEPQSIHQDRIVSTVNGLYALPAQVLPTGANALAGLSAAVIASLARSVDQDGDPVYSYLSGPLGKPVSDSLNLEGWDFDGGTFGHMMLSPGHGTVTRAPMTNADGATQRGIPAMMLRFTVVELVGAEQQTQLLNDSPIEIQHDGVPVMDRVLEYDDDLELEP